jgi:hypothetical protein
MADHRPPRLYPCYRTHATWTCLAVVHFPVLIISWETFHDQLQHLLQKPTIPPRPPWPRKRTYHSRPPPNNSRLIIQAHGRRVKRLAQALVTVHDLNKRQWTFNQTHSPQWNSLLKNQYALYMDEKQFVMEVICSCVFFCHIPPMQFLGGGPLGHPKIYINLVGICYTAKHMFFLNSPCSFMFWSDRIGQDLVLAGV